MASTPTRVRLVNGSDEIVIRSLASNKYIKCKNFELGFPNSREVTQDIAGSNGQYDLTRYFGSRTVSIDARIKNNLDTGDSRHQVVRTLRKMLAPANRIRMYVLMDGMPEFFMDVRGSGFASNVDRKGLAFLDVSMTFTCPSGLLESSDVYQAFAYVGDGSTGLVFNTNGFTMTTSGFGIDPVSTSAVIDYDGAVETPPVIVVSGPASNLILRNNYLDVYGNETSKTLDFGTLVIGAGDTLTLSEELKTAVLQDGSNVFTYLTIDSEWWKIYPGVNTISLEADSATAATQMQVLYRVFDI